MGTSVKGQKPYSPSDVDPTKFGSGGSNYAPNQGVANAPACLNDLLGRVGAPVANTAGLQATVQADRADGMLCVTLDAYHLWVWQNGSSTAASSTVIEPTDTSAGANGGLGRWVQLV